MLDGSGENADNVGSALVQGFDFAAFDVESGYLKMFVAEEQRERQTDVTHADNSNAGLARFNPGFQIAERNCG